MSQLWKRRDWGYTTKKLADQHSEWYFILFYFFCLGFSRKSQHTLSQAGLDELELWELSCFNLWISPIIGYQLVDEDFWGGGHYRRAQPPCCFSATTKQLQRSDFQTLRGEHPSEVIFGNLGFSLHCCARMLDETGSLLLLTDSSVLQELAFALVCPIPSTL